VNNLMRGAVYVIIAYATARSAKLVSDLRRRVALLEAQMPVCRQCGTVQRDDGAWVPLESLGPEHTVRPGKRRLCAACEEKKFGAYS